MIDGDGGNNITGLSSGAQAGSTGDGGIVEVIVSDQVTIQSGGVISNSTFSEGNAGSILLSAAQLVIDRLGSEDFTGIISGANPGSTGNAGNVEVNIEELVTVQGGAEISSNTFSAGDAGSVALSAGELLIDRLGSDNFTGIFSRADVESTGNAGDIEVTISELATVQGGGQISSSTVSVGNAGSIVVSARDLMVDRLGSIHLTGIISQADLDSIGNAGSVEVNIVEQATIKNGGEINSNTFSEGNAGSVTLSAGQLLIDGQESDNFTGITSQAATGSTGNAGSLEINVEELATITDAGEVSTAAFGEGNAGSVLIESETGVVAVSNSSFITSSAVGTNSDSGSVVIQSGGRVAVDESSVTTQSEDGMAGPIIITAGVLNTNNAQITTTTESLTADGGDITVSSDVFALQGTVIQANAVSGGGGEITVDSSVVPFGSQFNTQLDTPLSLDDPELASFGNVAQAVAPTGVSVPPEINSPEVDITGALSGLDSDLGEVPTIGADPCSVVQSGAPSTLIETGRGALPVDSQRLSSAQSIKIEPQSKDAEVYFIEQKLPANSRLAGNDVTGIGGCRNSNI